jgi:creatinine amidohydrolase
MKWDLLTSPRLGAIDRRTPVMLNIGAIEQHGGHLPLVTDALIGRHFTDRIDAALGERVLILPQIAVCCSRHHMLFPGTLTVRHETFLAYLTDMLESVVAHGFTNIVLFNSHGGNLAIGQVALEAFGNDHPEIELYLLTWWKIAADELASIQESGFGGVGHACEFETSLIQLIAPELIDEAAAIDQLPIHAHDWAVADMRPRRPPSQYAPAERRHWNLRLPKPCHARKGPAHLGCGRLGRGKDARRHQAARRGWVIGLGSACGAETLARSLTDDVAAVDRRGALASPGRMTMKLVFEDKRVPEPVRRENDADNIWGPAWHAWRCADGYLLDYATGDMAGSDRRVAISAEDFARLMADPTQFDAILHAHGG